MTMIKKALTTIMTMLAGFWAANLISMSVRTDIEAGTDMALLIDHISAAFHDPLRLSADRTDLLCGMAGMATVGLAWLYRWSMRRVYRDGEEYGSARWARPEEMAAYTDREPAQNLQMTATEGLSLDAPATRRNLNVLMIGGAGTGKTSGYVLPNLRKKTMNYVCTDPKGELYAGTHRMLQTAGYRVRCLDLVDLTDDTKFNPLVYLDPAKPDLAIMRLVTNLISNTDDDEARKHAGDDFWTKAERSVLTSLLAWVYYTEDESERNLCSVVDMAGKLDASEEDETKMSEVDAMMQSARELIDEVEEHPDEWEDDAIRLAAGLKFATKQYRPFEQGAGETKKSINISVGLRLAPLTVSEVRRIVASDNIGIDLIGVPGQPRTAIYLALPDEDKTFNFLAAIFYQCLFESVMRRTRRMPGQTLPVPLHCFLDEFANVGRIPGFERLISTIRSRNVSASIIVQNLGQLKSMYAADWETITGNCDNVLYYGGMEQSTTEWVSRLLGKQTIDTRETSDSKGMNGSHTISYRRTGRELMMPDELAQMDNNECVYVLRGLHPFRSRKLRPGVDPARPKSRLRHSPGWQPIPTA